MKNNLTRRNFVKSATIGGIGLGLAGNITSLYGKSAAEAGGKIGIIGLDTSHCVAFTNALNGPKAGTEYAGFKIVAAYPKGSNDIKSSVERIPGLY